VSVGNTIVRSTGTNKSLNPAIHPVKARNLLAGLKPGGRIIFVEYRLDTRNP